MLTRILCIFAAITVNGLMALLGGVLPQDAVRAHAGPLVAFAAGSLLGAAFLDLLPEALGSPLPGFEIARWCLVGICLLFVVDRMIWAHSHNHDHDHDAHDADHDPTPHDRSGRAKAARPPMIALLLAGDAVHNVTDGVALAAAFLVSPRAGIATALAIVAHEIPHEIGDYAILVSHGLQRSRALFWILVVQFGAAFGAAGAILASRLTAALTPVLLSISAGGFIYVATANLLPELRQRPSRAGVKPLAFFGGIAAIAALELLLE